MIDDILIKTKEKINYCFDSYKKQLFIIKTGRANSSILNDIKVICYEDLTPLIEIATIQIVNFRTLIIKPWDKLNIKYIKKAIFESNLGLHPIDDGDVIRIIIPELTEDRRKEHVKKVKHKKEEAKISIRNIRRYANELIKKSTKDLKISKDDEKRNLNIIQDLTNEFIIKIDKLSTLKEREIMTI